MSIEALYPGLFVAALGLGVSTDIEAAYLARSAEALGFAVSTAVSYSAGAVFQPG